MKLHYSTYPIMLVILLCLATGGIGYVMGNSNLPDSNNAADRYLLSSIISEADPDHYQIVSLHAPHTMQDTVNGVQFSLSTPKMSYKPGEKITVNYAVKNLSPRKVSFNFSLDCPFDMVAVAGNDTVSWYLQEHPCLLQPAEITLEAFEEKGIEFPAIPMTSGKGPLTVWAGMRGYDYSRLSIQLEPEGINSEATDSKWDIAPKNKAPKITFDQKDQVMNLHLEKGHKLSISVYIVNGQKVNQLSSEKFFPPGIHQFSFKNARFGEGVLIVKIAGNEFSQTKIINILK
ncbi:MAG: hypothetical protein GF401_17095 [Chitinivibrionales bacterium]|nr:hypothetical protein [Chitinivibrionales bacterium]